MAQCEALRIQSVHALGHDNGEAVGVGNPVIEFAQQAGERRSTRGIRSSPFSVAVIIETTASSTAIAMIEAEPTPKSVMKIG